MASKNAIQRRVLLGMAGERQAGAPLCRQGCQDAAARRQRKEAELYALNKGVPVLPEKGE